MEEAKKFKQEFSNLRLMMTRMSNRLSEKTGFDPSKGKDAQVRTYVCSGSVCACLSHNMT